MTTTFYAPPSAFRNGYVTLPESEARHAAGVLRRGGGEEIVVVDGEGGWHRVQLDKARKESTSGQVIDTRQDVGETPGELTVGLALLKNKNRFETFLEKATELGADRVVPLQTRRTEKKGLRRDRAERLLVAALKQCGRSRLPELTDVLPLRDAVRSCGGSQPILCHEDAPTGQSLTQVLKESDAPSISLWLGPEGGFSDDEVTWAEEENLTLARLGPRRLRAETAAIVATGTAMLWRENIDG